MVRGEGGRGEEGKGMEGMEEELAVEVDTHTIIWHGKRGEEEGRERGGEGGEEGRGRGCEGRVRGGGRKGRRVRL